MNAKTPQDKGSVSLIKDAHTRDESLKVPVPTDAEAMPLLNQLNALTYWCRRYFEWLLKCLEEEDPSTVNRDCKEFFHSELCRIVRDFGRGLTLIEKSCCASPLFVRLSATVKNLLEHAIMVEGDLRHAQFDGATFVPGLIQTMRSLLTETSECESEIGLAIQAHHIVAVSETPPVSQKQPEDPEGKV